VKIVEESAISSLKLKIYANKSALMSEFLKVDETCSGVFMTTELVKISFALM
jgi:hypothetical protein